jgi:hypothetical protein
MANFDVQNMHCTIENLIKETPKSPLHNSSGVAFSLLFDKYTEDLPTCSLRSGFWTDFLDFPCGLVLNENPARC